MITFLLTLLIKFFFIVLIVTLVGGFIFTAKNYIFNEEDIATIKSTFKVKKTNEEE